MVTHYVVSLRQRTPMYININMYHFLVRGMRSQIIVHGVIAALAAGGSRALRRRARAAKLRGVKAPTVDLPLLPWVPLLGQ